MNEKKEVESSKKILKTAKGNKDSNDKQVFQKPANRKKIVYIIGATLLIAIIVTSILIIVSKNRNKNTTEVNFAQIEPQAVYY